MNYNKFHFTCTGNIRHLLFRSDNHNDDGRKGFTAFLQCFNPQDANLERKDRSWIFCHFDSWFQNLFLFSFAECSNGSDDVLGMLVGKRRRRKRSASHLPQGEAKAVLSSLSAAVFDVVAKNLNRQLPSLDNATTARASEFLQYDIPLELLELTIIMLTEVCHVIIRL